MTQSLSDIEVVCVDDGSTDASRGILDSVARRDPRVTVIDNARNLGAGEARNRGIAVAAGSFIRFVDADDLLPPESTELMYRRAVDTRADVVRGGLALFRNDNTADRQPMIESLDCVTTLREERSLWIPFWHTSYLIARHLVAQNRLAYPKLRRGEDPVFMASVLVHATRIALLPETVYLYRRYPKSSGSAGTTFSDVTDMLASAAHVKSLFAENYPECWHDGYAPFLLQNFRKFIARCQLNAVQLEFVASRVEALWGPAADPLPDMAGRGVR